MSKSLPMPQIYADKFEWAAAWADEHGMTLPPDTPELRSLRNWFCFKLNQYKKGTLGESNLEQLAKHGLDFAEYEATNTGKGERLPDAVLIGELRQWHAATGSYALTPYAPALLLKSRMLLREAFGSRGRTARARKIEEALPGFSIPLWGLEGQPEPSISELQWWTEAAKFEDATHTTPAYLGVLHPQTERACAEWATNQLTNVKRLTPMQKGFLLGAGLIVDTAQRKIHKLRESNRAVEGGRTLNLPTYKAKDKRLNTFLGVCMYARCVSLGTSDREIMAAFGISPEGLVALQKGTIVFISKLAGRRFLALRKLYLSFGERLLKFADMPETDAEWAQRPASLGPKDLEALRALKSTLEVTKSLALKQDIAFY